MRWHARQDVRLDEVPVPTPRDTEVLIRIQAAAICGTDVDEVRLGPITVPVEPHPVNGRMAPMTLGHEMVGVVSAAGDASALAPGMRVAPWPSQPCGQCRECLTGHANRCPRMVALGMTADGGMADYLLVEGSRCVPMGREVEDERAVLVEPFAVALHALHQGPVTGRRVAVVGIGSLGLCVVEASILAGASEVVAVSRSEQARRLAREAGASDVLPPDRATAIDAEIVFETAGAASAVAAAAAAARRGATIVVLGGHPGPTPVDLLDLTVREVAFQGSVSHCFEDFVRAAEAITAGDLARTRRPITEAPLEQGPELLQAEESSTKRILKPGLS
ncbi:MAG TPA: alcohol dehydrogenase catalytic domain-containing protein [Candidatus Limnocylindrales bacterium]